VGQIRALLRAGDHRGARAAAERRAAARPLDAEVHLLLGMLYLESGADGPALDCLRRATFLDADHPLAQFTLGRAWLRHADQSRARAAFVQARRLLIATPDSEGVSTVEPVLAGELRRAVESQIAQLVPERGREGRRNAGAESPSQR